MSNLRRILKSLPPFNRFTRTIDQLKIERKQLRAERDQLKEGFRFVPPGHFFSPIPDLEEVKQREPRIWGTMPAQLPGIDLNEKEQLALFDELAVYYPELPFPATKSESRRYHYLNSSYSYSDGIFLFSMIRRNRPRRIIEVGSGNSSCVMLDTNELFFNNSIELTFIEPYPQLLFSLMREEDKANNRVMVEKLQDVKLEVFETLEENDILFIDSTHVSKIDSDVNYLFFEILPILKKGVYIHIHDISYPFEYSRQWIYEGRAWNETYLMRAFLQYNHVFKIKLFTTYLHHFHHDLVAQKMPLTLEDPGGCIWLEKVS
jgi:predicted O-methyltransferase YrrM